MSYKGFNIGELKINIPVVQGGMGVGVSLAGLAGAVSKCGGLGVISVAQIGFKEPDFISNTIEANLRALKKEILKAKEISNNAPIAVNIMRVLKNYNDYVKASIDFGADLIISGAGLPMNLPKLVENTKAKIAPIVSSFKAVKVLLRNWDKHDNKTADMIVIEGPKAGGHLGFKKEEIDSANMFDEIKLIINHIKEYEDKFSKKIPVVFGGGIFSRDDVKTFMSTGIDGVQVGSRFVTTYECDAHQNFKDAYLKAKKEDIIITQSPVGMPGRAINNDFIKSLSDNKIPIKKCLNCIETCNVSTTPYCITSALINSVTGNIDEGLIFAGSEAYKCSKMESVNSVITDLVGNSN